jgi:hypothetical protein
VERTRYWISSRDIKKRCWVLLGPEIDRLSFHKRATLLEKRWILNLSMHFRDKSKEKFFVTFA